MIQEARLNHGAVAVRQLVVPGGDGSKLLDVAEVVLDKVAGPVPDRVVPILEPAVDPRGNGCDDSIRGEREPDGVGIVGFVSDEFACGDAVEESGQISASAAFPGLIVNLTRRPVLSTMAISFVVSPPRLRPIACLSADSSGGQPLFLRQRRAGGPWQMCRPP